MVGLRDAHVGLLLCVLSSGCATFKHEPGLAKCGPDAEPCLAAPYAETAWSTAHATSRNDDYVPVELPRRYALGWTALEGFATLMSPSIGPEGHVYITTPSGPGTSTLHAFDADGRKLWESDAWEGPEGVDSCSGFQTPVVDRQGDIYLSDCNQMWSFSSTGKVRWVVDLPRPPEGAAWQNARAAPVNPLVTAILTRDGAVGGMSIWGDIVLVSRTDGSRVSAAARMPGSVAIGDNEVPKGLGIEPPPGVWQGGFMDPEMIPVVWYLFEGVLPSANTPAVHPETGRIFATGLSRALDDDRGALYGFDFVPGRKGRLGHVEVGFEFVMGPGSGSSPGISPDDSTVYVSDGEGVLYAVDSATGHANWSLRTGGQQASPSIGADGMIYLLGGKAGFAIHPDGTKAWTANLDALAEARLPPLHPGSHLFGPSTFHNAVPTITDSGVLTSITVGYLAALGAQSVIPLPVAQLIVLLDPKTGALIESFAPLRLRDTVEGFVATARDGVIYANQGALVSTTLQALAPHFAPLLPDGVALMTPVGGLQVFQPVAPDDGQLDP